MAAKGLRVEETRGNNTKYHLLLLQVFCLANNRMSMGCWADASQPKKTKDGLSRFWANFRATLIQIG